jgi:hypothetical protein
VVSVDCVAVVWLVWFTLLLVSGAVSRSVHEVAAIGWQVWGTVWAGGLF